VRRVDRAGTIMTVAGTGEPGFSADGTRATGARLDSPSGIAVDVHGRIYIAEAGNHRIRRVERPALRCRFNGLAAIALIEPDGLLVSNHFNSQLRLVKLDRA
jgi:NHL repeat